ASHNHATISNNKVQGQTCNVEATLLKGAIVAQTGREVNIVGNKVWNCQQGIHIEPRLNIGRAVIDHNEVKKMTVGCSCIRVVGSFPNNVATSMSDSVMITNNDLYLDNTGGGVSNIGIRLDATNIYGCRTVHITGNKIDCYYYGIQLNTNTTHDAQIVTLKISDNTLIANASSCLNLDTSVTPHIDISSNTFRTGVYFVDTDHIVATTSSNVSLRNNLFVNWPSGTHAWVRVSTPGGGCQFRGNQFQGVPVANMISTADALDLGRTAPTWVGAQGDIVETPLQIEQGAATSKYVINGYWYDATAAAWKQMRTLTGN
ncbi:MAG: hypothetical protein JSS29_15775, partial [Proteobacteria bacterium]|nr:hypothetical protein [Pseudomonadota bacterium]